MHANLNQIVEDSLKYVSSVVLITSGVGLEKIKSDIVRLRKYRDQLEIFLQFDSFDDETLKVLRSEKITSDFRKDCFYTFKNLGIPVTPVCVISPMSSKKEVVELTQFAFREGAAGIAFQPIKQVGRTPSFNTNTDLELTTDFIQKTALQALGSQHSPSPFSLQPFDLAVNWISTTQNIREFKPRVFGKHSLEKGFRIPTCSYWDLSNYVSKLATESSFYFTMYSNTCLHPLTSFYLKNLPQLDNSERIIVFKSEDCG